MQLTIHTFQVCRSALKMVRACFMIFPAMLICLQLKAQKQGPKDTLTADSMAMVQFQINQDDNQQKIDSLVGLKLEQELKGIKANTAKARKLEEDLKRMRTADSVRKKNQQDRIDLLQNKTEGYPVAPFGDTLFMVNLKLGSTTAAERASQITSRIKKLYEDNFFRPDSLKIIKGEWGHEVIYNGSETILIITDLDALWYKKEGHELAKEYAYKIRETVMSQKEANSVVNQFKRAGLVLMILLGAAILILLIQRLFNWLLFYVLKNRNKLFKGIVFGKFQLLNPAWQGDLVIRFINFLKVFCIAIGLYLSLPLLFTVFPGTEGITQTMLSWIIKPARDLIRGLVAFLPNLFTIVVIFLFMRYVVKGISFFAREIERGHMTINGFHRDFAKPTFNIIRFILYAFMLVIIFPYLPGSGSPAFQGISVFLGVLLSLGSSSAINNIIAGLVITYMRPFKPGDRIKIGDITGDVVDKTMLVIKLKTIKNEEITVPNSTILSSNTINFSSLAKNKGLVLHTTVTIGYDVPWRLMHDTLIKAALSTPAIMQQPPPFVWQTSLDDFYVSYQLNAYTSEAGNQGAIYSELHQHIQDCCRVAGIEIMSPHYRAERDGNKSTIPD